MAQSKKPEKTVEKRRPEPGDEDYVGYGYPPKQHRFQKGMSGNSGGRPKGSKNYSTVMRDLLATRVTINKDGEKRSIPLIEAVGMKLANKALGGDFRSIQEIMNIGRAHETSSESGAQTSSAGDDAALAVFIGRVQSGAFGDPDAEEKVTEGQPHEAGDQENGEAT